MSRPPKTRTAAEHLVVLSRFSRSIELDASLSPRRKRRLIDLTAQLMAELQKEMRP